MLSFFFSGTKPSSAIPKTLPQYVEWNNLLPVGDAVILSAMRWFLLVTRWLLLATAVVSLSYSAVLAQEGEKKSSAAARRQFSSAAELQNEKLFDLAAKEWAEFIGKHPDDPLAGQARHYQGVCLIQLKKYGEAVNVLAALIKAALQAAPSRGDN